MIEEHVTVGVGIINRIGSDRGGVGVVVTTVRASATTDAGRARKGLLLLLEERVPLFLRHGIVHPLVLVGAASRAGGGGGAREDD